jgi:carbon-monoxide dehydrogenase large subunit
LAQVAASELGVAVDRITVRQGDTHLLQDGGGTIASRTAVVVGNAVAGAAEALRNVVLEAAAGMLEADPADLRISNDRVEVAGAPGRSVTLADCAAVADAGDCELAGFDIFDPTTVTFANGVHAAVVEVDEVTGTVRVLRYVVVHDCGRVINPVIVDAQVAGGVAQGIGAALLEELLYDEAGQLTTASFLDYQIPRATDLPDIEVHHVETVSERNPLGLRGVGEAGAVGPPAAIAGAVEDALADLDVVVDRCPLPPSYVVALIDPSTA